MAGFLAALAGLAGPITARILVALGMSVVSVGGVDLVLSSFKSEIVAFLGTGPAAGLQLAGLAGCWVGLGIVFGACTFAGTIWGITAGRKILGVA